MSSKADDMDNDNNKKKLSDSRQIDSKLNRWTLTRKDIP